MTIQELQQNIENALVETYATAVKDIMELFNRAKFGAADAALALDVAKEYIEAGIQQGPEALGRFDLPEAILLRINGRKGRK